MNLADDNRVFNNPTASQCIRCTERTNIGITGLGYLCSYECLREQLEIMIEGRGLRPWVKIDLEEKK